MHAFFVMVFSWCVYFIASCGYLVSCFQVWNSTVTFKWSIVCICARCCCEYTFFIPLLFSLDVCVWKKLVIYPLCACIHSPSLHTSPFCSVVASILYSPSFLLSCACYWKYLIIYSITCMCPLTFTGRTSSLPLSVLTGFDTSHRSASAALL